MNDKPLFFTSDLHFGHENVIKYCDRPFKDAAHMNEELISRWNKKVPANGRVFILGDVGFMDQHSLRDILFRLNGELHLVYGNHDKIIRNQKMLQERFSSLSELTEIKVKSGGEKLTFVLCHYAMRVWSGAHRGNMHLYGHSHGSMPDDPSSLSMDVGIDTTSDYTPYSLDQILVCMYKKSYRPVDHHGTNSRE
jgi:calcineurin-like phosphoesterase family protein